MRSPFVWALVITAWFLIFFFAYKYQDQLGLRPQVRTVKVEVPVCSAKELNDYMNTVFGEITQHSSVTIKQKDKSYIYKLMDIKEN